MVPLKHGESTVSIICGLTKCRFQFQFNPQFSFAGSIVLAKQITVAFTGKKYNHVKIGRYEEIRIHFSQILMDMSGSELQLGGEVNSKGASLENAELSQIRYVEKQTYSGRYCIKKIKFYMDYFVSKLRLTYFSTFSGNRSNPDQIKIITPELVAAGRFKNQPSQEMPFGTLKEMPHGFSFFKQRPHTSASLFHSHLCPRGSAPSVKPKQTARPRRPLLQCSVVPCPALRGGGSGMGSRDVLEHGVAASWQPSPQDRCSLPWPLQHRPYPCCCPCPYKASRWLDVTPGEGRRHGIGDWYQLLQRKMCHTRRV